MELTFASYNIHKAVGTDRRRDPDRILAVLREIDADVIALQEADRRIGRRESVLPRETIED
ncbi:MAG: endonuclease/exonuclease/phosphatase family protein, partial [Novosphingobium sp.]